MRGLSIQTEACDELLKHLSHEDENARSMVLQMIIDDIQERSSSSSGTSSTTSAPQSSSS
eukprot:CAMPEP_0172507504 /NCGR_PEP_ID=MMETSP1066-20121228/204132_1 /TAXON_ID=671091 /ORGANISM="Coscinodiscus wailesii, Strain CCMP2513" /LENGTH=59 /DNA_ID=CAMNT_0013285069 /DNA_START=86 /DNA_END=262 /DNA_ORIENTATION=+